MQRSRLPGHDLPPIILFVNDRPKASDDGQHRLYDSASGEGGPTVGLVWGNLRSVVDLAIRSRVAQDDCFRHCNAGAGTVG